MNLTNKNDWLNRINQLTRDGMFEKATEVIDKGLNNQIFKLTTEDATKILDSCGIDVRYWFVKPLVNLGGEFPIYTIDYAFRVLDQKNLDLYEKWAGVPDAIKGFKLVIEIANNESYDNLFVKMIKKYDDNEFGHKIQDYIYRKFIRDILNNRFRNIKEIDDIAKYINEYVVKKDIGRWYA